MAGRLDYPKEIQESLEELTVLEKEYRGTKVYPRIEMLRFLKTGEASSQGHCAKLLGFCKAQVENWWSRYKKEGVNALLQIPEYPGRPCQIPAEAWLDFEKELESGNVVSLDNAREYLNNQWGTTYKSISSIHWQFKLMKIKLKTGRPRHRKADSEAQAVFKKLPNRYPKH